MVRKHKEEMIRWANSPMGTEVWYKNQGDITWRKIATHPSWLDSSKYIVDDEWAEVRKQAVEGKPVQVRYKVYPYGENDLGPWFDEPTRKIENANWNLSPNQYRIKPDDWYHKIPRDGILCWVSNDSVKVYGSNTARRIYRYREGMYLKFDAGCNTAKDLYRFAIPVKFEECWKGESMISKNY